MATQNKNPIDDDLLRELGLDPMEKTTHAAPKPQAQATAQAPLPEKPKSKPVQEPAPKPAADPLQKMTEEIPVQVVAVLGKKVVTLKEVASLKTGDVVELKKQPHDMIDLVANGKLVAQGELVLVDGQVGIQIRQLI